VSLIRRILGGPRERDDGSPGVYLDHGALKHRDAQGGPLTSYGAGGGAESPLTLTAGAADETPLTVNAHAGQSVDLLEVYDEHGTRIGSLQQAAGSVEDNLPTIFTMFAADGAGYANLQGGGQDYGGGLYLADASGTRRIYLFTDDTNLRVEARSPGQTSDMVTILDASGNTCFSIHADGTVHIKTGGTIHADL
jgi:hypothetical protein